MQSNEKPKQPKNVFEKQELVRSQILYKYIPFILYIEKKEKEKTILDRVNWLFFFQIEFSQLKFLSGDFSGMHSIITPRLNIISLL